MSAERNLKAAYRVVGPKTEPATYMKCGWDKETRSMTMEEVTEEKEVFYAYFPMGHSIRVGRAELIRLGLHIKPRIVDLDSGDVIEKGGDPYDFGDDPHRDANYVLEDAAKPKPKAKTLGSKPDDDD